jgi:tRNA threonylcarbamoyladenosine biosynthesis protein TsaE
LATRNTIAAKLQTNSPEETASAGEIIGESLLPGDVVALTGELGSGKTVLTKGIAVGLGFPSGDSVTSPTYKLLNQYKGRVMINHFDAYRLKGASDFMDAGGEELLGTDSVCIVEWAERIMEALPEDALKVFIRVLSNSKRQLELEIPELRRSVILKLADRLA